MAHVTAVTPSIEMTPVVTHVSVYWAFVAAVWPAIVAVEDVATVATLQVAADTQPARSTVPAEKEPLSSESARLVVAVARVYCL